MEKDGQEAVEGCIAHSSSAGEKGGLASHSAALRDRNTNRSSDRRALFDKALEEQRAKGGTAGAEYPGAEYLFGPQGLDPVYWGVTKQQLKDFGEELREAIRKGEIPGQPDRSKPHYLG